MTMEKSFINAYAWLYGSTKKQAKEIYKNSSIEYIESIIECFNNNAKKAFYND